jgi:hypothetical protein
MVEIADAGPRVDRGHHDAMAASCGLGRDPDLAGARVHHDVSGELADRGRERRGRRIGEPLPRGQLARALACDHHVGLVADPHTDRRAAGGHGHRRPPSVK